MRRLLSTILILATAIPALGIIMPLEKSIVDARWNGRIPATDDRGIDVLAYHLQLDFLGLPPSTNWIDGTASIEVQLLDPPPAELRLDLVNNLSVRTILLDGLEVMFTHEGDSLRVPLPLDASPGATHEVSIEYAGSPPRHGPLWAGLLFRRHGPDNDQPTVGNISQPYSSHSWFPCKDHPSDKATLTMDVTAPDSLTVAANGVLLETVPQPDERLLWRWATDHPIAPYLVGVAISEYESWYEDCPCRNEIVPLDFHVFAEDRATAEPALEPTCAMMQWIEDWAGPYPFPGERYAQAEAVVSGAMENQTVSLMGQMVLLDADVRDAQMVVVHELVHHWFGDSLTPLVWQDIWLSEGFARYTEALWAEHTGGRESYLAYLDRYSSDHLFIGDGLLGDPFPILQRLVYDKGAWVLHMMRLYLGDTDFFAFLHDYATHPDLVHAGTSRAAMTEVASQASGRDMAAFLAPWLDTEAVPALDVRWRDKTVEVLQNQGLPFFPLVVPVRVYAGAEVVDMNLRMETVLAGKQAPVSAAIDSVVIDPEGWLLFVTEETPPPKLYAAQPRPNPAVGQVNLAYQLRATDRVQGVIYDVRGRRVHSVDLGVQTAVNHEWQSWIWDGVDDQGRRVASGVYWMELRTSGGHALRKVTLLR